MIKHETSKVIHGEGMPRHKHPDEKGNLIVNFIVEFPDQIAQKNLKQLQALLPGKSRPVTDDCIEEKELTPVSIEELRMEDEYRQHGHGHHGMPGNGVQCATQ